MLINYTLKILSCVTILIILLSLGIKCSKLRSFISRNIFNSLLSDSTALACNLSLMDFLGRVLLVNRSKLQFALERPIHILRDREPLIKLNTYYVTIYIKFLTIMFVINIFSMSIKAILSSLQNV